MEVYTLSQDLQIWTLQGVKNDLLEGPKRTRKEPNSVKSDEKSLFGEKRRKVRFRAETVRKRVFRVFLLDPLKLLSSFFGFEALICL